MKKNAVILLSGGLDSTTTLAVAADQGYACHALSFSYGQRHSIELDAAKKIASTFHVQAHQIIPIPLSAFGHSALTDHTIAVPDYQARTDIPVTYVPARNTIFLSFALAYAEVIEASDIFIGVSHIDYSNYPDCRPEFIHAFETLANLATRTGVEHHSFHVHAPLIHLSKAETIKLGLKLGVDYGLTISCYSANEKGEACGRCDSCELRKRGFLEAGIADPTHYE